MLKLLDVSVKAGMAGGGRNTAAAHRGQAKEGETFQNILQATQQATATPRPISKSSSTDQKPAKRPAAKSRKDDAETAPPDPSTADATPPASASQDVPENGADSSNDSTCTSGSEDHSVPADTSQIPPEASVVAQAAQAPPANAAAPAQETEGGDAGACRADGTLYVPAEQKPVDPNAQRDEHAAGKGQRVLSQAAAPAQDNADATATGQDPAQDGESPVAEKAEKPRPAQASAPRPGRELLKTRTQQESTEKSPADSTVGAPAQAPSIAEEVQAEIAKVVTASSASAEQTKPPASGTQNGIPTLAGMATTASAPSAEAAQSAQETPAPAADQETLDQVVLGLKGKFDPRAGKAEIQLEPPNLGTVKVSLSLESGNLTAEFQSSSDVVRDLLKGNLEKLKTVLEGQGVAVDRLSVQAPASSGGGANAGGQQAAFGNASHDGRSAGEYRQDARQGRRQADGSDFSRAFREAQANAPIDMVA